MKLSQNKIHYKWKLIWDLIKSVILETNKSNLKSESNFKDLGQQIEIIVIVMNSKTQFIEWKVINSFIPHFDIKSKRFANLCKTNLLESFNKSTDYDIKWQNISSTPTHNNPYSPIKRYLSSVSSVNKLNLKISFYFQSDIDFIYGYNLLQNTSRINEFSLII